jgi:hypothetical protein
VTLLTQQGSKLISDENNYSLTHEVLKTIYSVVDNHVGPDSILLNSDDSGKLRMANKIASGASFTFGLGLVNLIGTISAELLLLTHALSDLRLVIELNSADQSLKCFGSPTAATYAIKDAFPNIGLVNLEPNTHNQIKQMSGNRYEWSSVLYRTFSRIHPAQQSSAVIPITAFFSSVRNMVGTVTWLSRCKRLPTKKIALPIAAMM